MPTPVSVDLWVLAHVRAKCKNSDDRARQCLALAGEVDPYSAFICLSKRLVGSANRSGRFLFFAARASPSRFRLEVAVGCPLALFRPQWYKAIPDWRLVSHRNGRIRSQNCSLRLQVFIRPNQKIKLLGEGIADSEALQSPRVRHTAKARGTRTIHAWRHK